MVAWRAWIRRRSRYSSPAFQFLTLTVVTFGLVLPLACHRLLYSYYFLKSWYLDAFSQDFLQRSQAAGEAAVRYFEELAREEHQEVDPMDRKRPWLVVTIVTVKRKEEYHYLLQVASRFHRLLQKCNHCDRHEIHLCNVQEVPEEHTEARVLGKFFPLTEMYGEAKGRPLDMADNRFEKEKQDYQYCLSTTLSAFNPEHVLLVEDDAVPMEDFFEVLQHLLTQRFSKPYLRDALYLKLYHPERLQRYINPEPMRILEWIGFGLLGGSLLTALYFSVRGCPAGWWPVFLFFMVYAMVFVELVGRHYLLELRRVSPQLYNVVPVTECCTPAMLFSASSATRVLHYLDTVQCRPGFAKDMALYSFLKQKNEQAFVVEPNLITHVGLFSTLRGIVLEPKLL
ncbi:transmembrane protein 246 [Latimeria chalumnae]|uniref:transmembrane protein 246 n=1 Tax=Latimeria chalumnae TaxID=7897 RepID=UPI0003C111B4|nr:PREDICTED: transmembrane protein 246 [Latimeria chalumnae]|eukprot:XP_006012308.1 PREDICTED: transmembrane protein 246 [Latimeria chalumnae]